jgi:hypothetical protein
MTSMNKITDSLIESLPTREDLVNALGLASRRSTTADFASVIGVFGAGLLIGAGLALLFAPKSGEDLRRDLGERLSSINEEDVASGFNRGVTGATEFRTAQSSVGT